MKSFKKEYIVIIVVLIGTISIFLNTYLKSREEYKKSYNFVITKIVMTPTKRLEFYDKNNKIMLWNYIISADDNIKIGDLIQKEQCSEYLYIKRKNEFGEYRVILKVSPTGIFPRNWFCD